MASVETAKECAIIGVINKFFLSNNFEDKLEHVLKIIPQVKLLFEEIKDESKEFEKISQQFKELTIIFANIVIDLKHDLNMIKPDLKNTIKRFEELGNILMNGILDDNDKKNCHRALERLSDGIIIWNAKGKKARDEKVELDIRTAELKKEINKKRDDAKEQIKDFRFTILGISSGITIGVFIGKTENGQKLTSLIPYSFLAKYPSTLWGLASGVIMGGIFHLIRHFSNKRQEKLIKKLNEIFQFLLDLDQNEIDLKKKLNGFEVASEDMKYELKESKDLIDNDFIKNRSVVSDSFRKSSTLAKEMIQKIEEIDQINVAKWSNDLLKISF